MSVYPTTQTRIRHFPTSVTRLLERRRVHQLDASRENWWSNHCLGCRCSSIHRSQRSLHMQVFASLWWVVSHGQLCHAYLNNFGLSQSLLKQCLSSVQNFLQLQLVVFPQINLKKPRGIRFRDISENLRRISCFSAFVVSNAVCMTR